MSLGVDLVDITSNTRQEFDWADLAPSTIAASVWSITPTGPLLQQPLIDGYLTSIEVSVITWGAIYRLVNTVTLDTGETEIQSIALYGGRL